MSHVIKPVHLKSPPQKILVIPLRYIGDTVLSVPLLRNLRAAYPDSQLEVMASKTAAPVLANCPYLDGLHHEPRGLFKRLAFLRSGHYDLVILLRKSVSMALLCQLAGIPAVVGYDKQRYPWGFKRWALGLDGVTRYPGRGTDTAQALHHLAMLNVLGKNVQDRYLELWTTPEETQAVERLLESYGLESYRIDPERPMAVLHAVSASFGKSVEIKRFIPALSYLLEKNYQVVLTGVAADREIYERVLEALPQFSAIHNFAGKTTLGETVALYRKAQLLLTVDSSPVHLGLAVGVPRIMAIYGPTNYRQWGAYDGVRPASEAPSVFLPVTASESEAQVPLGDYTPSTSHIDISPRKILAALETVLETMI
ncbi:MAG: glycosyltransferase family 9 protein [Vampirovibrionales bacterium]|nr:glycosyltransferase family 9 protein [Vampirovibrionales bacterium]